MAKVLALKSELGLHAVLTAVELALKAGTALRALQRRACREHAVARGKCAGVAVDRCSFTSGDAAAGRHIALQRTGSGAATARAGHA